MADKKLTYTIDSADIDSDLTDFPVVVQLDSFSGINNYNSTEVFDELSGGKDSYTKLLIHADEADASTTIADSSDSAHTITAEGNAAVKDFNADGNSIVNYSGYFNGTDAYLTVPTSADFNTGSGDFCLEGWIFLTATTTSALHPIFVQSVAGVTTAMSVLGIYNDAGNLKAYGQTRDTGSSSLGYCAGATTLALNTWYHLAYVRHGSNFYIYVNGVSDGSASSSSTAYASGEILEVGGYSKISAWFTSGYIAGVAFHKGDNVYPSGTAFTPPLTIAEMTNDANTTLFLDFTELDQGETAATITDSSASAHTVTNVSSKVSGCTFWWSGAVEFDGTGDYLTVPDSTDWIELAADVWTIDLWVFPTDTTGINIGTVLSISTNNTTVTDAFVLYIYDENHATNSGKILTQWYNDSSAQAEIIASSPVIFNAWNHIELVCDGGTSFILYLNGVSVGSDSSTRTDLILASDIHIGTTSWARNNDFKGMLAEPRFSKGIARHTTTFTPPPKQHKGSWERIHITDADSNELYCEVENWDLANEKATLHVKVPTVSSSANTVLTLDYDANNADNSINPTITAKSVVFDIADNLGDTSFIAIRAIEFWLDGSKITMTSGFTSYETSKFDTDYSAYYTFNTSISKLSAGASLQWTTPNNSGLPPQRIIIVFDTPLEFDQIVYNNAHSTATETDRGANNIVVTASTDEITSTVYNATITNSTVIFDGVWEEHTAVNEADDTTCRLFDGLSAPIGVIGSFAGMNVWDSNFVFVSHQAQDPSGTAPQILDSTSYGKDGTSYGTMLTADLIDGATGKMLDYDGTDDYTNHGYDAAHDITDTLTLEASFTPNTTIESGGSGLPGLISRYSDPTDAEDTYGLVLVGSTGVLALAFATGGLQSTTASWVADTNYNVTATYDDVGVTGDLFVGGVKETLTYDNIVSIAGSANNLVIGKHGDSGDFFPGAIGEVRISNIVRSDDWITTTNLSLTDALFTVAVWTAPSDGVTDRYIPAFTNFPKSYNVNFMSDFRPNSLIRQTRKGFSKAF